MTRIDKELDPLLDAIRKGVPAVKMNDRMIHLEAQKTELEHCWRTRRSRRRSAPEHG